MLLLLPDTVLFDAVVWCFVILCIGFLWKNNNAIFGFSL